MKSTSLNDLFDYDYKIYQDDNYFKFSIDSVLLAEFISVKKDKYRLLDMCSGNFPIPMILHKKYKGKLDISAVELQSEIYKLGVESLKYNEITNIKYYNDDIKNYKQLFNKQKFDIITCNPPYFKVNDLKVSSSNDVKAIARHELYLNLEDVISISSKLLETQGSLYLVHRPERLADIINLCNKYGFGVKKIQMVYNDKDAPCCFILVEATFNGKDYVTINKPVFLDEYASYQGIFGG